MSKLIAYFSRAGENYVNGSIQNLAVGNTEAAAKAIQEITGADLFRIESMIEYSRDYSECIEEAKQDQRRGARPALKTKPPDMGQYEVVYLGYPNYWGTMPMAVFTFLEYSDFSGKSIRPFCTHEGSKMGSSVSDIKRLCPGADVGAGLAIRGCNIERSMQEIENWIENGG